MAQAFRKVFEEFVAGFGGDRFGMELHAFEGEFPVAHAHDLAVVGPGRDFEAVGQGLAADRQRVVAHHGQRIGQAGEDALALE
jgi:hypothetical protein